MTVHSATLAANPSQLAGATRGALCKGTSPATEVPHTGDTCEATVCKATYKRSWLLMGGCILFAEEPHFTLQILPVYTHYRNLAAGGHIVVIAACFHMAMLAHLHGAEACTVRLPQCTALLVSTPLPRCSCLHARVRADTWQCSSQLLAGCRWGTTCAVQQRPDI